MPIGSILSKFIKINLAAADEKEYEVEINTPAKIALKLIGIPHLGFRTRANVIFKMLKKIDRKSKILDAGCGYGIYSIILADKGHNMNAIDIERKRINSINSMLNEYPKIKSRINLELGSLTSLPYKNEEFDVVLCSEVLEHIKQDEKAFSEISRVLKNKGFLILSVPTYTKNNIKEYKKFGHMKPGYSLKDIEKLATKNGLRVEEKHYYDYFFGDLSFKLHNSMKDKVLLSLFFYPLYFVSSLDKLFKYKQPNGSITLLRKL